MTNSFTEFQQRSNSKPVYLLLQTQQWKHQNYVWNLLKINNNKNQKNVGIEFLYLAHPILFIHYFMTRAHLSCKPEKKYSDCPAIVISE